MGVGDITISTPVFCATETAIKTAADALTIATVDDDVMVVPANNGWLVFKVERAAA